MELNDILPKQDDPQRLLALNGVPKPFWLSAIEINLILDVLAALLGNVSALYKGEYENLQYLDAAHPLPEPGSYAQIIVVGDDNLKASWDNTDKKWFLDGIFILPGTNAAYLLKSVYDTNSDGIIDKAAAIQAVLNAGGTKYYGTKDGSVGVFDFPQLGGTAAPAPTELFIFTPNWQSGLTFLAFAVWVKNGITYNDTRSITLSPADGALDRFDLFVVNLTTNQLEIIEGVPGDPAVEPSYNPILFLGASFVSVKAGQATPENVAATPIWTEGAEWLTTGAGPDFDFANIESPAGGTYSIKVVSPLISSQSLPFIPPAPVLWVDGMGISYKIKNITGGDYRWLISGLKSNGKAGSIWINPPLNYSYSSLVYQLLSVIIPAGLATITKISLVANVDGLEYFLDDVRLVTGSGNVTAGGATKDYVDFQISEIYQYIIDLILQGDWAENRYTTVLGMLADQGSQTLNQFQFVRDARQDTSVTFGWAAYELTGAKTTSIANYRKLTYKETFDLASGAAATLAAAKAYADSLVLGGGSWKENEYPTITELLAGQAGQNVGKLQHVLDASIDATVTTGWATYELLGAKTADISNYRKLSEKESMDVAGITTEPAQVTITTAVSFNTELASDGGYSQNGKNVLIQNGTNAINITVGATSNGVYSFQKEGTGAITFLASSGKTIRPVDGTAVMDGAVGSTATASVVGTVISLRISNAV